MHKESVGCRKNSSDEMKFDDFDTEMQSDKPSQFSCKNVCKYDVLCSTNL